MDVHAEHSLAPLSHSLHLTSDWPPQHLKVSARPHSMFWCSAIHLLCALLCTFAIAVATPTPCSCSTVAMLRLCPHLMTGQIWHPLSCGNVMEPRSHCSCDEG